MIWKEASLSPQVVPTDDRQTAVIVEVKYEEKDSWNPLNGTTDKRRYHSEIQVLKRETNELRLVSRWEIPSWTLTDSVYYHSGKSILYVLHGKDDEYGTLKRRLSIFLPDQTSFSYPATPDDLVIFQISPSPSGDRLALVTAVSNENWEFSEFELKILDPKSQSVEVHPLSFWTALPLYGIRWSNDSKRLYIRTPDRVLLWEGKGNLAEAKAYPDCFSPSTNFGSLAYRDSFIESQNPWKVKLGERKPEAKMVQSLDAIRVCD